MDISQNTWKYGGAGLLSLLSLAIGLPGVPNVWVPMPVPLVIVGIMVIALFPFVMPVLYLTVLKIASSSEQFPKIILALVISVGILNGWYFINAWHYGVDWQGASHTNTVALENAVGFSVALIISSVGVARKSRTLALTANLLMFLLLSWCAFPYLGELP